MCHVSIRFRSSARPAHTGRAFHSHCLLCLITPFSHHLDISQTHFFCLCPSLLPTPEAAARRTVVHARCTCVLFETLSRNLFLHRLLAGQWTHRWACYSWTYGISESGLFEVSLPHHEPLRSLFASVFAVQFRYDRLYSKPYHHVYMLTKEHRQKQRPELDVAWPTVRAESIVGKHVDDGGRGETTKPCQEAKAV